MRGLSCSIHQLVDARQETISKLRASADYLDSIWMRCVAMCGDVDLAKDEYNNSRKDDQLHSLQSVWHAVISLLNNYDNYLAFLC